ncbi:MAG: hypothetical protein D6E12_07900 [Desulfovibrio sp.]|nr:MAG: hypothetical protein D6E12_07900 [Desulfovibrio sp.]
MKRSHTLFCLIAAAGLVLAAATVWAATTHWYNAKGYVYYITTDNDMVTKKMFLQIRDVNEFQSAHQDEHFRCFFEDVEIHVPIREIRSIVVNADGETAIITRRADGYSYTVLLPKNMGDSLTGLTWAMFLLYNEVNSEFEEGAVDGRLMTKIEFVDEF